MTDNFFLQVDLRKSPQKTVLNITETDLEENKEKVLSTLQKECVDLNTWFYIVLYYYSKGDYASFEKFSKELSNIDLAEIHLYRRIFLQ